MTRTALAGLERFDASRLKGVDLSRDTGVYVMVVREVANGSRDVI